MFNLVSRYILSLNPKGRDDSIKHDKFKKFGPDIKINKRHGMAIKGLALTEYDFIPGFSIFSKFESFWRLDIG